MFSAFFGNYLLNKGIVTAQQLSKVLENQKEIRLKLGTLAINDGFMTSNQVETVHDIQGREDRRFGEIAIEKGYITEEQLNSLLKQQQSEHLLLAQALMDENIITMDRFEEELNTYKKEFSLNDEEFEALKNNDVDMIVRAFVAFEDTNLTQIYIDYVSLFLKNMIRFIDPNIRIDRVIKVDNFNAIHMVKQSIKGEQEIFTGIFAEEEPFLSLAGIYAEEKFDEVDDFAKDAAGEFLNLHNGIFVVNLSNDGVEMNLNIQEYVRDVKITTEKNLYQIPIYTSNGVIDILVGEL